MKGVPVYNVGDYVLYTDVKNVYMGKFPPEGTGAVITQRHRDRSGSYTYTLDIFGYARNWLSGVVNISDISTVYNSEEAAVLLE